MIFGFDGNSNLKKGESFPDDHFSRAEKADLEKALNGMNESHKPHRAPHSGAKAEKKKAKMNGAPNKKGNNPKAFSMASGRKAAKIARRSTEVDSFHLS
jgi:hypothetical protein